ncbi:hypothetical protein DRB17_08335 [Ferruginivarius sediminum]|uniref:Cytochrome c-552/4 domain-containing protein n=2 Tax=Ferruginivarius sediminum TaxID=2661937 RepID=A0A369THJ4_9PROT|nr:hypothetical protein DRB17_08335 [Ferruginivarius sediminum]
MLLHAGGASAQVERDPQDVVGPKECAECHKDTVAIWRNTHHYATYREMPRNKDGIKIARKMGLRRIKEGSLCLDCHFTTTMQDGEREPVAGISCESCHGAGKGYLEVHSEFSGKEEEDETAEEEAQRWAKSEAAGMIRPKMMYRWAKNCYSCHVVPQEKLVNVGGHTAGSPFELVAWSQGEVRHNVWYNEGESNPPADMDRRRKMFVVGMAVELETALRAVGKATEKAEYAVSMAKRAARARKRFAQATELVGDVPEMAEITKVAKSAGLKLNNEAELTAAADRIGELTRKMVDSHEGSAFAAIDPALPGKSKWKGEPSQ